MANINTEVYDKAVQHAAEIRIQEEKVFDTLKRLDRDHKRRMGKIISAGGDEAAILKEMSRHKAIVNSTLTGQLEIIGNQELVFQKNTLKNSVGRFYKLKDVSRQGFFNRLRNAPVRGNENLTQQVNKVFNNQQQRIKSVFKQEIIAKSQLSAMAQNTSNLTKSQLDTIFATSSTKTQSEAFTKTVEANSDVLKGYRFTAVLDSKTSDICQHHDGTVYKVDDNRFTPPLHWNCRSVMTPVIKSHSELLATVSDRLNKGVLNGFSIASIARFDGINPIVEDYDTWLRRQPVDVQMQHLNHDQERLALFHNGNLKLKDFQSARGSEVSAASLAQKGQDGLFDTPIRTTKYQPAENHDFKVNAYRVDDLISDKKAQSQLRELFEIDERHSISPLSITEFRGANLATKKKNRIKSRTVADEDLIVDPISGLTQNPLIYRPNSELLEERLDLVRKSKILNTKQKKFIEDFANSMEDRVSTNNRSVIVENLRVTFERQLSADSPSFNRPWENLTAVVRAENVNAVQNVSRRLERLHRKNTKGYVKVEVSGNIKTEPRANILGEIKTFNQLQKDIDSNQKFVDSWESKQGIKLARKLYFSGKLPLRNYFLPPSQSNPLKFKIDVLKYYDKAVDSLPLSARNRKLYKQAVQKALRNPATVTEEFIIDMTRDINVFLANIVDLEYVLRKLNSAFRKKVVNNDPTRVEANTKALASGLKALAEGSSLDYDVLAIRIGEKVNSTVALELPGETRSTIQGKHKTGSRILKALEEQGVIKVGQAMKTRQSTFDVKTGRPDPGGYREIQQREVEIIDPELFKLQRVNRELYIARRIGLQKKDRLYLEPPVRGAGAKNLRYRDAKGRITGEKVITRSAAAKLGTDEDAIANQLDRDFQKQFNFANSQEWALDNEFTDFFIDLVYYTPKDAKRLSKQPNLFRGVIKQRDGSSKDGGAGTMLMQSLIWHRQNGTTWSNSHQTDGRGRFYESGYLAATRGELVRPFLHTTFDQKGSNAIVRELKKQLGATVGDGNLGLTTAGRYANFEDNLDDILDAGLILQGKYNQKQRNINAFLENKLISHVDDIGDAAEIGKIARYSLEIKRIEDHLNKKGYTMRPQKVEKGFVYQKYDAENPAHSKLLEDYKTRLLVENDASASGAQQIALATADKQLADASNVMPTPRKQRLYDLAAMETVADPEFQKIFGPEGLNLGVDWEDLQKGAKAHNMVLFYGAGDDTKTLNIEQKFAKVILKKDDDAIIVYKEKKPDHPNAYTQEELYSALNARMVEAEAIGATNTLRGLQEVKAELDSVLKKETPIGAKLLRYAEETDDEVADFVKKATNARAKLITNKDFQAINRIMSRKLADIAPSTEEFIVFEKQAAKTFINASGIVDLPWSNYRGKVFTQFYRPVSEQAISFRDPVTGRMVSNNLRESVDDGLLRSSGSAGDASIGFGVNGNHTNDASLVQGIWIEAAKENKRIATIHDGFFTPIEDADWAVDTLYNLMGDAVESNTIKKTLKAMRKKALENVNRESRRARAKMVDKLLESASENTLTQDDLKVAFKILPELRNTIKAVAGLNDYQLNKKIGTFQRRAILSDLIENVDSGFVSVKKVKDAMFDVTLLERRLTETFGMTQTQILNNLAKHGTRRRLLNTQKRFEDGELSESLFFQQYFKEPSMTPQETGKYRDAVKKAKAAKKPIPTPSEALGKKPSPAEVLRKKYGISNERSLIDKIENGQFDFEDFFKKELLLTENPLDLDTLKKVTKEVMDSHDPDINIKDVIKGIKKYRGSLRSVQRQQIRNIEKWYKDTLEDARRRQLIDKNITNKKQLNLVDKWKRPVSEGKFTHRNLSALYKDWSEDLEKYFEIGSLAELNNAYRSGNFNIEEFLRKTDNRYRQLTKADIVRPPSEGQDRYGIGP